MFKKYLVFVTIIFVLVVVNGNIACATDDYEEIDYLWLEETIQTTNKFEDITISSKCGVAYDRASKTVLWGKNEDQKVQMASTTKIMTAIIFVENVEKRGASWNEKIEVCKQSANVGGSRLGLHVGDEISLNDLLYGLMLCSGNDAAVQIAVNIAGDIEGFAALMNAKAIELGLMKTKFITPHGLDEDGHYTTAYELAKISDYALNIKKISDVVKTKTYNVTINNYTKTITNTNELLGYLNGVNGVKTGFTNGAGRCLVTSTNRDGFEVITVILGADTKKMRTKDSIRVIEHIYANYELVDVRKKIEEEFEKLVKMMKVTIQKGVEDNAKIALCNYDYSFYPVKKRHEYDIDVLAECEKELMAPVSKGKIVGKLTINIDNKKIGEVGIMVEKDVCKKKVGEFLFVIFENYKCHFN